MTLLEKAKKFRRTKRWETDISDEKIELALAWLKDEVSTSQVSYTIRGYATGSIVYQLAIWLRHARRQGRLEIKENN
jgi:hypothetical protein